MKNFRWGIIAISELIILLFLQFELWSYFNFVISWVSIALVLLGFWTGTVYNYMKVRDKELFKKAGILFINGGLVNDSVHLFMYILFAHERASV
ncbi:hypothetical protein EQG49_00095 [Periweissella cryptocerci]|uniref:Uncharacterized protein n=1 Tax=Periweissella cryptocerci TaxID=2506420 RepID=A0A4P6YQT7_9LACO|nr:hypothetical protein [Periweissella cryptocerci]QBO34954.1 hypothetical protein EQG49_00095 [Periweissella cryptocerci]